MSNNKYEERVAMLVILFNNALMALPGGNKVSLYDALFTFAKLSVQREAEAYQAGYMSNFPENTEEEEKMWLSNCEWEMIEFGLIPPKTETE